MGHTKLGFGLSWSEKNEGIIVSGADDNKICIWDIKDAQSAQESVQPLQEINYHQRAVNVATSLTTGHQVS